MGNYIKIPLAVNPPRSFVVSALNNVANATGGGTVSGTGATAVIAGNISTSGSGTGLTVTVAKGADATIQTATITVTAAGEGYKVGDTITIAADTTAGTTQWDADIVYTIVAADLVTSDGSDTNNYQLIDVDNLLTVDGFAGSINIFQKKLATFAGSGLSIQNIQLELDNAPTVDYGLALRAMSDAIVKAIQAPHSLPIVDWGNSGVEVLTVDQS